ncbi:hypothetical protein [Bradyrhizobium septentrionale]|uniref:Uncharacterized protein n=1 Tax=Bradyrhizobium septentrionale TaxID=1404411 RepID=A0ABZ2P6C1_9BRAD
MAKARAYSEGICHAPDDKLRLTPFVKCGETTSMVGYRDDSSGMVVASVELPTELIERSILANVSTKITLSGSGDVTSATSNLASGSFSIETISLNQLIHVLLDRENIHMEETTESELGILLETLQESICAVQRAIATLSRAAS